MSSNKQKVYAYKAAEDRYSKIHNNLKSLTKSFISVNSPGTSNQPLSPKRGQPTSPSRFHPTSPSRLQPTSPSRLQPSSPRRFQLISQNEGLKSSTSKGRILSPKHDQIVASSRPDFHAGHRAQKDLESSRDYLHHLQLMSTPDKNIYSSKLITKRSFIFNGMDVFTIPSLSSLLD